MKTNYDSWKKSFDGNVALVVRADDRTLYEASEKLKARMEQLTPVGDPSLWRWPASSSYTPGTLRASWNIEHTKMTATIFNQTPYAFRVETGWSTQAPNGMMRVANMEFPQILAKVAAKNKV